MRKLSCGHEQTEAKTEAAAYADRAQCRACVTLQAGSPLPVLGKCGAMIINVNKAKAHVCGKEARFQKPQGPRCAFHYNRGAR